MNNQKTTVSKTEDGAYLNTKQDADVHIYCDGICEPNPGECSSGLAVYESDVLHSLYYGRYYLRGTNNIAELNGLLEALKLSKEYIKTNKKVQILADSLYAINCITVWSYSWKQKNWTKKKNEPVKNSEIIKEAHLIYEEIKDRIIVSHIKGHYGFEGNELADKISALGIKDRSESLKKYEGSIIVEEILKKTLY